MTRAKKVDANQADIVKLFRQLGASVAITSDVGSGFVDLVVQFMPRNRAAFGIETHLVEIKDGSQSHSRQALTPDQVMFHAVFKCSIVRCRADVFKLVGIKLDD